MGRTLLSRFFFVAIVFCLMGAAAGDVVAQTNQLDKTLARKFPEGYCPIDTELMGTFVTDTGHIRLTFQTANGYDDGGTFVFHQQLLDDVVIMEASRFDELKQLREFCYFDGEINALPQGYAPNGDPQVPFYEPFNPLASECAWDETNGATVNVADGRLELGNVALGTADVSTSVVISGLATGTPYVICAEWHAVQFFLPDDCSPSEICLKVLVDDVPRGCGPVPAQNSTWGGVKALYK